MYRCGCGAARGCARMVAFWNGDCDLGPAVWINVSFTFCDQYASAVFVLYVYCRRILRGECKRQVEGAKR